MRKGYVDIPEGQVHYREEGSGAPIVLLHGHPLSSIEYDPIIPILAKDYRAIAMDTLGLGNSDLPPRPGYTVEEHATSVVSFLDSMELDKVNLVGHFAGATVAVEVAVTYPERVDKLVISGILVKILEEVHDGTRPFGPGEDHVVDEEGKYIMDKWELWKKIIQPYVSIQDKFAYFVHSMDRYRQYWHTTDYYAYEFAVVDYMIEDKVGLIQQPTLLLSGEHGYTVGEVDYVAAKIPRCRSKIIEGQGWYPGVEKHEEFAAVILDFLKNPGV